MNAANPLPASTPAGDTRPYEPSMEEILASIRRIISDDQSLPSRAREPDAPASPARTEVNSPELSAPGSRAATIIAEDAPSPPPEFETMERHGVIAAPQFAGPGGPSNSPSADPASERHVSSSTPLGATSHVESPPHDAPIADTATARPAFDEGDRDLPLQLEAEPADAYFDSPIEREPGNDVPSAGLFSSATDHSVTSAFNMLAATRFADNSDELMNLARDMIRPLLKTWLDDNLPSMVERMVRQEIERVARGGR